MPGSSRPTSDLQGGSSATDATSVNAHGFSVDYMFMRVNQTEGILWMDKTNNFIPLWL
ncbi:hypothetical protein E2320_018112, partial [Naja naja]